MRSILQHVCGLALCAIMLAPTSLSAQAPGPISSDATIPGTLDRTNSTLPSGAYYREYSLVGEIDAEVKITLDSDDFDAYLIVRSPAGFETKNDDLNDQSTNAGLRIELDEDGTWKIIVTSYDAGATGAYTLAVIF